MNKINKIILGLVLNIFLFSTISFAQEWVVPESDKAKANPIEINLENVNAGSEIFKANCQSCHGEPGMNNGLALTPIPPDVTSAKMQANTEGGLFYKITKGRGAMPAFTALQVNDIWKVSGFIKSFSSEKILSQEVIDFIKSFTGIELEANSADKLKNVTIKLSYDTAKYEITANVTGQNAEAQIVPLVGEKIIFSVKRYFGDLIINEVGLKTNGFGVATAIFPKDLPGDSIGNVNLIVSLDSKKYKDITTNEQIKWGVPTTPQNLLDQGAMWGKRVNAPWWIVALYLSIAGGVWITIIYVVLQILKIKKLGKVKS